MTAQLTEQSIKRFVEDWYRALDRHDDFGSVKDLLVDDGLEMRFPEATARGHEGFADWYDTVTKKFFDEEHTVTKVEPTITPNGDEATVEVVVNWQAKMWQPPSPYSEWLGFDADQTWVVVPGDRGPQIKTYIVNGLEPMPGSATL